MMRVVWNKYYPPDFDPALLARFWSNKNPTRMRAPPRVRIMAPFTMRCTACNTRAYCGTKFNAIKETTDCLYKGIYIYRFVVCCTSCAQHMAFRTDPATSSYVAEYGMARCDQPADSDTGSDADDADDAGDRTAMDMLASAEATLRVSLAELAARRAAAPHAEAAPATCRRGQPLAQPADGAATRREPRLPRAGIFNRRRRSALVHPRSLVSAAYDDDKD